jgi:hypothetical protein
MREVQETQGGDLNRPKQSGDVVKGDVLNEASKPDGDLIGMINAEVSSLILTGFRN